MGGRYVDSKHKLTASGIVLEVALVRNQTSGILFFRQCTYKMYCLIFVKVKPVLKRFIILHLIDIFVTMSNVWAIFD